MIRTLDLFSGIGGISLGLRWAGGYETVGFCECDAFCREVLAKYWPGVWQHDDVRTLTRELIAENCGRVDMVTGGVPCQPASCAGNRKGSSDERWLWPATLRVVRETEPLFLLFENVPGLIGLKPHGLDWICGQLEDAGYEPLPLLCGACHVGAPHRRLRVWIVGRHLEYAKLRGYSTWEEPERAGDERSLGKVEQHGEPAGRCNADLADAGHDGRICVGQSQPGGEQGAPRNQPDGCGAWRAGAENLADAQPDGCGSRSGVAADEEESRLGRRQPARGVQLGESAVERLEEPRTCERGARAAVEALARGTRWPARPGEPQHDWEAPRLVESSVGRTTDGIPRLMARLRRESLRALGNAVVPQVVCEIGKAIRAVCVTALMVLLVGCSQDSRPTRLEYAASGETTVGGYRFSLVPYDCGEEERETIRREFNAYFESFPSAIRAADVASPRVTFTNSRSPENQWLGVYATPWNDCYVFAAYLDPWGLTPEERGRVLAAVASHERGHMAGLKHGYGAPSTDDRLASEGLVMSTYIDVSLAAKTRLPWTATERKARNMKVIAGPRLLWRVD